MVLPRYRKMTLPGIRESNRDTTAIVKPHDICSKMTFAASTWQPDKALAHPAAIG
jgi:hypothetical protein